MVMYHILQLRSVNKNHLKPDEKKMGKISTVHWLKIASSIQNLLGSRSKGGEEWMNGCSWWVGKKKI